MNKEIKDLEARLSEEIANNHLLKQQLSEAKEKVCHSEQQVRDLEGTNRAQVKVIKSYEMTEAHRKEQLQILQEAHTRKVNELKAEHLKEIEELETHYRKLIAEVRGSR